MNVSVSSNGTLNLTIAAAEWTVLPVFSLFVFITAFLGNGLLMVTFIRERSLRTPFNVYIINLLAANLAVVIFQYPMDIVTNLHSAWLLGNGACNLYLYANSVFGACICNSHMLIAINRMWAVSFPLSYRTHHSRRTAVCLCLGVWVYVHVGVGPPVIIDALYFRLPIETNGCMINAPEQQAWEIVIEVIYWLPQIVMLATFPITWCAKRSQRKRVHGTAGSMAAGATQVQPEEEFDGTKAGSIQIQMQSGSNFTVMRSQQPSIEANSIVAQPVTQPVTTHVNVAARSKRGNSHGFLVLALLTVSVCICWTPNNVFYTISFIYVIDDPVFYDIQTVLFILQTAIDPIIFTLALSSVRAGLLRLFRCQAPAR
ncbi:putative Melanopsin [Hypsibius exemplaris]|uniref:Melanopsin n=1 Tax=Hypsibius exemplaris TaxID=2072580 RepID=A0A1W0WKP5_HYPEX|nr:putative Melanopsin [Hypsibius exemplaris]